MTKHNWPEALQASNFMPMAPNMAYEVLAEKAQWLGVRFWTLTLKITTAGGFFSRAYLGCAWLSSPGLGTLALPKSLSEVCPDDLALVRCYPCTTHGSPWLCMVGLELEQPIASHSFCYQCGMWRITMVSMWPAMAFTVALFSVHHSGGSAASGSE